MPDFQPLLDSPGLYLTGEDNLRLTTFGGVAGVTVVLEGRLVDASGRVIPIAERHLPSSNYTSTQTIHNLAAGVLTNVQLRASVGSVARGGVFAVLEIVRGTTVNAQATGTLLQGYVTSAARLAWPGSPIESSTAGVGRLRSITGTDPAANTEISETVPAGVRWRLVAAKLILVTDANVANRNVELIVDDGAGSFLQLSGVSTQPASLTVRYNLSSAGAAGALGGNDVLIPIPPNLWLGPGFRFRTQTNLLQVTDNYAAPQYVVEEFIE